MSINRDGSFEANHHSCITSRALQGEWTVYAYESVHLSGKSSSSF